MSRWHFAFFRIVFGVYLAIHFWQLIDFAPELWSSEGSLPNPHVLPSWGVFPNILFWITTAGFSKAFVTSLFLASLLFIVGFGRRWAALFLWYGWACLLGRNPFIANPGIPFVGLMLLCCVVVPVGEPLSFSKAKADSRWDMPFGIYEGVWVLMAVGYSLSGLHKCLSPSWVDGTAVLHLLNNPLSRDTVLREWLLDAPLWLLQINTWAVLGLEILFAPLCLFKATRRWAWLAMIFMHLGILSLVSFADLTLGVLMVHVFTFDERWLPAKKTAIAPILFFDGVCGLCNRFVQILFDIDESHVFNVATLQGKTAAEKLPEAYTQKLNSLVVYSSDGKTLMKSQAVLFILNQVGGMWRVLYWLARWVPVGVRDNLYDFVAANRYRWFGKSETCRLPTSEERLLFLD